MRKNHVDYDLQDFFLIILTVFNAFPWYFKHCLKYTLNFVCCPWFQRRLSTLESSGYLGRSFPFSAWAYLCDKGPNSGSFNLLLSLLFIAVPALWEWGMGDGAHLDTRGSILWSCFSYSGGKTQGNRLIWQALPTAEPCHWPMDIS